MNNRDKLLAQASQDQTIAHISSIWNDTDLDIQDEFVSWLQDSNPETIRSFLDECPDQWLLFIQLCTLTGLRQAVMEHFPS